MKSEGGSEANVTLSVASTITLDLQAPQEAMEVVVTVTVESDRPTEVKTSEISTVVAPVTIENLPQVTRNFLEFADTVPGLAFTVDNKGNTSLVGGAQAPTSFTGRPSALSPVTTCAPRRPLSGMRAAKCPTTKRSSARPSAAPSSGTSCISS